MRIPAFLVRRSCDLDQAFLMAADIRNGDRDQKRVINAATALDPISVDILWNSGVPSPDIVLLPGKIPRQLAAYLFRGDTMLASQRKGVVVTRQLLYDQVWSTSM